ncbi:MAG: hypothetical protein ACOH5I_00730 [Oligoflexus sp.]
MSVVSQLLVFALIFGTAIACQEGNFGSVSVTEGDPSSLNSPGSADQKTDDKEIIVDKDKTDLEEGMSPGKDPTQDRKDRYSCAENFGVDVNKVHIAGSMNVESINVDKVLVAKVTGNQNQLNLTVSATNDEKLPGICLFLAGNQAQVDLQNQIAIGRIHVIARGNKAKVNVQLAEGASIDEVSWDGRGNQPSLDIQGPGTYTCPENSFRGQLNCQ